MNSKILWGVGAVVIITVATIAFLRTGGNQDGRFATYCGTDGKLTKEKPTQSNRSYCIDSLSTAAGFQPNQPERYRFKIRDDQGNVLKEFDTVHEKIMHFIVVRKDLAEFQHLHPEYNASNSEFTLSDLKLSSDGEYRLFADFTPTASQADQTGQKLPVTIYEDVIVGDIAKYQAQPLGDPTTTKTVDGYTVALSTSVATLASNVESELKFSLKQGNAPVTDLKPYLGAFGHAVILRKETLEFIHAHPITTTQPKDGIVNFMTTLPRAGTYKVFGQFQIDQKVITADFVLKAAEGSEPANPGMMEDMPGMNH